MTDLWERRLRRARILEKEWPFAAELLRFFRAVTEFQSEVHARLASSPGDDPRALVQFLYPLCHLVEQQGPEELAQVASGLGKLPYAEAGRLLEAWIAREGDGEGADRFFPRALLQPWRTALAGRKPPGPLPGPRTLCPSCGGAPIASVLREDRSAETARRTLACSTCPGEWDFPRVLCPACGEERPEKLPRYTAEELPWVRVEACDSCRKYLKAVDLTKAPEAEPVVDELASTPLDVIARERGYEKITPNLAGM
jgi:FdhE protein